MYDTYLLLELLVVRSVAIGMVDVAVARTRSGKDAAFADLELAWGHLGGV